ncbi:10437_t:CDS:2 [Cetraspora pellucida]|uniref:10437_t:CDS:1 n=1 Tax=Cetraspora pellucida TaxID=1433469 RepID=A0A9N9NSB8_9GLOM|nr:10437_t:CDS:2 [Cetraspora pellucida]
MLPVSSSKSLSSNSSRKENNRKHNAGRKSAKDDAYVQQTNLKKYYNYIQQRKYQKQQKLYTSSLEKEKKKGWNVEVTELKEEIELIKEEHFKEIKEINKTNLQEINDFQKEIEDLHQKIEELQSESKEEIVKEEIFDLNTEVKQKIIELNKDSNSFIGDSNSIYIDNEYINNNFMNITSDDIIVDDNTINDYTYFIDGLNRMRFEEIDLGFLKYIKSLTRLIKYNDSEEPTKLFATVNEVEICNRNKLNDLSSKNLLFKTEEWSVAKNNNKSTLSETRINLKIGVQVLYIWNEKENNKLVNRSTGIIVGFKNEINTTISNDFTDDIIDELFKLKKPLQVEVYQMYDLPKNINFGIVVFKNQNNREMKIIVCGIIGDISEFDIDSLIDVLTE